MISVGVLNCTTAGKGTGINGCLSMLNVIQNFILARKGWSVNVATDSLDQDAIDGLVQSGQWIILPAHASMELTSEETVYETLDSGNKIFVRDGLIEILAQFSKGVCFHKALHSISLGNFDLMFVDFDQNGNSRLWGEETTDGKFKGFDLNMVNAENFAFPTGTTSAKTPFRIQFSSKGTSAFNKRLNFAVSPDVDFASLNGVIDVYLKVVSSDADDLQIEVYGACDRTTPIVGLSAATMWQIKNAAGADVTPSSVVSNGNVYTFTGLTAGEHTIQLRDKAENSDVVVIDDTYYSSDEATVTLS